jgi:heme-degrading monooxygenase HmoA
VQQNRYHCQSRYKQQSCGVKYGLLEEVGEMDSLAQTPPPPYYAVLFSSIRTAADPEGYEAMAEEMLRLGSQMPGFLGIESARGMDGFGITISYWTTPDAIAAWKEHAEHRIAQRLGKQRWYEAFRLRVCRVEAERTFARPKDAG